MSVDDSREEFWREMQNRHARQRMPEEPELPLKGGGGGGTSGPMEPSVSLKEYVDKADEAVESRLVAKLDQLPGKGTIWGAAAAIVGGVFSALAIGLAAVSWGGDRFDAGLSVAPTMAAAQQRQQVVDQRQDAQLSEMDDKLDLIINQTSK